MIIVGIDPGINGGIAFYDGTKLLGVLPIPSVKAKGRGRVVEWEYLATEISDIMFEYPYMGTDEPFTCDVFIEQVGARPGQGVVSMFKFGYVSGWLRGTFERYGDVHMVTPQKWKKSFGLTSNKDAARELATKLFPDHADRFKRKKDDGVAEAALIAYYGYQEMKNDGT